MRKVLKHGRPLAAVVNMRMCTVRWEGSRSSALSGRHTRRQISYLNNFDMTLALFRTKETETLGYVPSQSFPVYMYKFLLLLIHR